MEIVLSKEERVDLGFLEPCESWEVESRLFPSKAGGKPAWLEPRGVPQAEELTCSICQEIMIFLCQIYAPYEHDSSNFHRTLFVFVCRNSKCCTRNNAENIRIFRSSLRRINPYYPEDPPNEEEPDPEFSLSEWLTICELCGCSGDKKCSKCKEVTYCSRQHQIIDWKENHKKTCGTKEKSCKLSMILFPEFLMTISEEELNLKQVDEEEEKEKFNQLQKEGKLGTLNDVAEKELEEHSTKDSDKIFSKFRERISHNPNQVVRYSKSGKPLLISDEVIPDSNEIPNCEYCGGPRQFEFQIMPQMLSLLNEHELDWGVLLFYTCEKSCSLGEDVQYRKEYVFKQDVSLIDIQ